MNLDPLLYCPLYILVQVNPPKIQKLDESTFDYSTGIQMNNFIPKQEDEMKMASQSNLPPAANNVEEGESGIKSVSSRVVVNEDSLKVMLSCPLQEHACNTYRSTVYW